jgi:hypothetical protein
MFLSHRTCNLTSFSEQRDKGMWFLLTGRKAHYTFILQMMKNGSHRKTENCIRKISQHVLKPQTSKLHLSVKTARNSLRHIKGVYKQRSPWEDLVRE